MNFTINQKDFYHGVQIVQRAVASRSTLPILKGIYLEAIKDKGLKLIANNLEMGIEYWVEANIIEEGVFVLPANELSNILRELPADEISFQVDEGNYQAKIKCLNSRFTLKGYQADEFPQLPEVEGALSFNFNSLTLKEMIEEVKFSTSTDQTQPTLTGGLLVLSPGEISLVATNTYRLAHSKRKLNDNLNELDKEIKVILPGTTLNELNHLIVDEEEGEMNILLNESYVRFSFNEIVFISRLIEGQFPNYKQVIPVDFKSSVKIDRIEFLNAVKRVSLIARLDSNVITLAVNRDQMSISSTSTEYGDALELVEIELEGEEQTINIDANYLMDVLRTLKNELVNILLIGPMNPLTIKKYPEDEYIYLIMPIRPGS